MKLTSPLNVRKLLAAINPPLPPASARESRQLLGVLDTAFRKHLDDIHPAPHKSASHKDHDVSIPDPALSTTTATHAHLDAILNHPMLRNPSSVSHPPRSATAAVLTKFDAALLENKVTPEFVAWQSTRYTEALQSADPVRSSGSLAPKIASWFTSLSAAQKQNFLLDGKVLLAVVPVMYADGMEAEVWTWLRTLYEYNFPHIRAASEGTPSSQAASAASSPDGSATPRLLKAEDYLVSLMIKAAIKQGSWDDAARHFIQAYLHRSRSGQTLNLEFSRRRLTSAVIRKRQVHQISAPVFDELLGALSTWRSRLPLSTALLSIYHPSAPSASGLRKLLTERPLLSTWTSTPQGLSKSAQHEILIAVLDGAQLCLDGGNPEQAREILNFTEANYPDIAALKKDVDVAQRLASTRQEVHIPAHVDLAVAIG